MTADHLTADCHVCETEALAALPDDTPNSVRFTRRMIVCVDCGDKRCAKATDHRNPCGATDDR